MNEIENHI